tara:strand:+ start:581 stop:898 length:318 start_codon:yes stop_codon:yes gene_type:complete
MEKENKINITQEEINEMWDKGYRPYEIYVSNNRAEQYMGKVYQAGEISGWDIKQVFSLRSNIESYPFFDEIIMVSSMAFCEEIFWYDAVDSDELKAIESHPNYES